MTWRTRGGLLLAALVTRLPGMVRTPLSDDEAIYAVVSRALLAGGTLYRDAVDHKPPALFLLYGGAEWLAGSLGLLLLHVATALVVWATAIGVGAVVRVIRPDGPTDAPAWAALAYVAFTTTMMPFDGLAANAELWMGLPTAWAVWLVLRHGETWRPVFVSGLLAGCAALFKYQGIAVLPVLALALVRPGMRGRAVLLRWMALGAGAALPGIAWWAEASAFGDAGESAFWLLFNFRYTAAGVSSPDLLVRTVLRVGFVVAPAAALYVWGARGAWHGIRHRDRPVLVILGWTVVAAGAVAMGGRWFGHYFHQLTAPLAVLLGVALAAGHPRRWLAITTAIPVAGFWLVAWFTPQVMQAIGDPVPDYAPIVAALDARAPRTATVCVWGNAPLLVDQLGRPLGCRFVSTHFLTGASPATPAQRDPRLADANIIPGMWDRFVADLDRRRPDFIVDLSPGDVAHWGPFPPHRYPALASRLSRAYVPVASVAGAVIHQRRQDP